MSGCSEAERQLFRGIKQEVARYKRQQSDIDENVPIIYRGVRESSLFFNSRFESGNLREVERVNEFEYNLYLNFDFNTLNYTQWFYFSVRNIKKGHTFKFNVMNLQKDDSSYSHGMKPFVYSSSKNREAGTNQWSRGGFDVSYQKNNLKTKHRESAVSISPYFGDERKLSPTTSTMNIISLAISMKMKSLSAPT
jgi:hypothetical protein